MSNGTPCRYRVYAPRQKNLDDSRGPEGSPETGFFSPDGGGVADKIPAHPRDTTDRRARFRRISTRVPPPPYGAAARQSRKGGGCRADPLASPGPRGGRLVSGQR
jgi:hypothetical protein